MAGALPENEAELEVFRQKWRDEVSARRNHPRRTLEELSQPDREVASRRFKERKQQKARERELQAAATLRAGEAAEEVEPRAYHDLPDKEQALKLGTDGQNHDRNEHVKQEPSSALEHYERAVEKETQGQLGDSIRHYRTAFKLDDEVHEKYKQKHFAHAWSKPKAPQINPSNASATVPGTGHHSLHGSAHELPPSLKELVDSFVDLQIQPALPPTDASPQERSRLAELPEEILTHVLMELAVIDIAAFTRLARVCKRLAYLVLTEDVVWKRVALGPEFGFRAMHYDYVCEVDGDLLDANDEIARYLGSYDDTTYDTLGDPSQQVTDTAIAFDDITESLLQSTYAGSWRQMFRLRPRVRFNGCYISTVNYTRPGVLSTNTLSWGAPVHVVTYFRYLRFFRDGTVISLLTVSEPADVVHHLTKDNLHNHHGNTLPSSVMKDALCGRWRLTGPAHTASSQTSSHSVDLEAEGEVLVETEGVVPKYLYKMHFALTHAGKGARNNKLAWKGFWSYNRLTDDWGEFTLKNDRAFYWSRVKSYGMGFQGQ